MEGGFVGVGEREDSVLAEVAHLLLTKLNTQTTLGMTARLFHVH